MGLKTSERKGPARKSGLINGYSGFNAIDLIDIYTLYIHVWITVVIITVIESNNFTFCYYRVRDDLND